MANAAVENGQRRQGHQQRLQQIDHDQADDLVDRALDLALQTIQATVDVERLLLRLYETLQLIQQAA